MTDPVLQQKKEETNMENRKIDIPVPELSDETLDQAAGGGNYFTDPYAKRCSRCSGRLTTDEEIRTGVCSFCKNDGLVPARP